MENTNARVYNYVNSVILEKVSDLIISKQQQGICEGGGFEDVRINANGVSVNLELIKGFKVVDTVKLNLIPATFNLSEKDWNTFVQHAIEHDAYLYVEALDRVFSATSMGAIHVSNCFQPKQPYVAGMFTYKALKECFIMARNDKEIKYLLQAIQPFVQKSTSLQISTVRVSENDMLFEEGDDSVGLSDMIFTREVLEEEGVEPSHFQFHVLANGSEEVIHLGCPDKMMNVDFSLIRHSVGVYAEVFKTFLETVPHPSLKVNGQQILFTNVPFKSMTVQQRLTHFIRDGYNQMPRRLERVAKCLPYLNSRQIRPKYTINGTPVFVFSRNNGTDVYVTVVGVLVLDRKTNDISAKYSVLEGGTLEGINHVLHKLGLSDMMLFADCLNLRKPLPDFEKMIAKK